MKKSNLQDQDIIDRYIKVLEESKNPFIEEFTYIWVGPEPLQPSLGQDKEDIE